MKNKNKTKYKIDETDFITNLIIIMNVSFSLIIILLSIVSYLIIELDNYLIGIFSFILALVFTTEYYFVIKWL
jgi:hypothetical protein